MFINRSSKVVKGGRRFSFSALVVVGDKKGAWASVWARRVKWPMPSARAANGRAAQDGGSLAEGHDHSARSVFDYCGAKVLLRPASPGTGIIAGKTVRAVLESAGVKDMLSKSLGSKNAANVVKATLAALLSLRLREDIYQGRGLEIKKKPSPEHSRELVASARSRFDGCTTDLDFYAITRS